MPRGLPAALLGTLALLAAGCGTGGPVSAATRRTGRGSSPRTAARAIRSPTPARKVSSGRTWTPPSRSPRSAATRRARSATWSGSRSSTRTRRRPPATPACRRTSSRARTSTTWPASSPASRVSLRPGRRRMAARLRSARPAPAGQAAAVVAAAPTEGDLQLGGLLGLPHAEGSRLHRDRRPEPRQVHDHRGGRNHAGRERRRPDARVQGHPYPAQIKAVAHYVVTSRSG